MKILTIFKLIKTLFNAKDYIIYYKSNDNDFNYIQSSDIDNKWLGSISQDLRTKIINNIGEENYGTHLNEYDSDLYNAYKEIDYQMAKSEYFEAAYEYYRLINDPNSGSANKAYMLFENLKRLEQRYKSFETE